MEYKAYTGSIDDAQSLAEYLAEVSILIERLKVAYEIV
jgi:hypothetical protein